MTTQTDNAPRPEIADAFDAALEKRDADLLYAATYPGEMAHEAFYGWAGDAVRVIAPESESDPAAVLVQLVVAAGCMFGRHGLYCQVESTRHYPNEFALVVGETALARKGTSGGHVRKLVLMADPTFSENIRGGLVSGEGLIYHVRDATTRRSKSGEDADGDPGVTDKRLLLWESEFAGPLAAMTRETSTLSAKVRAAWDDGTIATATRKDALRATNAHISIIGHATRDDLKRLPVIETRNGFANRFLFVCARRHQVLPFGGTIADDDMTRLGTRLRNALQVNARAAPRPVTWAPDARARWDELYRTELGIEAPEAPPALTVLTARAAPHVLRLALTFALLACEVEMTCEHLAAAVAIWRYCAASAAFVFGHRLIDPDIRRVLRVLQASGPGVAIPSREIYDRVRGLTAERLADVMTMLTGRGLVTREEVATAGRPSVTWSLASPSARVVQTQSYKRPFDPLCCPAAYTRDERTGLQNGY
jgi:hypothetical protein